MKTFSGFAALFVISTFVLAGQEETSKQIRIFVPDRAVLDRIWSTGVDFEGATGKVGGWMEFVASERELRELQTKGISFRVVIDDLAQYYAGRLPSGPVDALGFGYGSMGGFYTYAEVVRQLDTMRLQYPGLITVRDSIARGWENHAVWLAKISDNPEIDEPEEPEVLYTALTHAREPQGMMTLMYYMWWLLENYGTNPEATYLVDQRQMYFIPVLNPDGYVYNQSIAPNGGGMWRENRRFNYSGCYGVDMNRNYGPFYMWNASNGGSSTTPTCGQGTYRGPTPFSEPETHAVDSFMRSHNIKTAFNYHTFGNYLIYPFGYLSRENGDSAIYRDWTYDMQFVNHYTNGTDQQTVNYSTRGNSDDYMFGDTTKPIAYAMTPEVGTSGFWPPQSQIFPLAIENLQQNKLLSYFAGPYPSLRHYDILDAGGNGFIDRNESFMLVTRFKNRGLTQATNISITISTNSPHIQFPSPTVTLGSMPPQSERQFVFSGSAAANAVTGAPFQVYFTVTDPQGFLKQDTIKLFLGTPTVVFADSASGGIGNWSTGQGWAVTANAHTPPNAFTDSPFGNYAASANNPLTLINAINLSGYDHAQLKYWTKWAIEPTWDFATVEISTNNGSTWATLRSRLSHSGSGRGGSQQPVGTWGFESYTPGLDWVEQDVDLSSYVGRQVKIRFRLAADFSEQRDGFYVDDIRMYGYRLNADTGLVVTPVQFSFTGPTGRMFADSLRIYNFSGADATIALTETTTTPASGANTQGITGLADASSILRRLRGDLRPIRTEQHGPKSTIDPRTPAAYSTIITDSRGEGVLGAVDVYRVDYQRRTNILGTFHDFRIICGLLPDSNVSGFISVDVDQDFGTGAFPTPYGLGLTSRDIGSEREIFFDASGAIIDSLIGIGRIPAAVVINTANDSIVGVAFPLTVTGDSVLTISTESLLSSIRAEWLGDSDGKMNVGVSVARYGRIVNPLPDFAPAVSHGTIGSETGVSWISEDSTEVTVANGDTAVVHLRILAARTSGTYNAYLLLQPSGQPALSVPLTMVVLDPPQPRIVVVPRTFLDSLTVGDSTVHDLTISNQGGGFLSFGIVDTSATPWLSVFPPMGVVDSGQTTISSLTLRTSGLQPESTYAARLYVVSNDPDSGLIAVDVSLAVDALTIVRGDEAQPTVFALHQNYPNPFNPETNIRFEVPSRAFVSLRVYNVLGQEVATLVNEVVDAGRYSVALDAGRFNLASGIIFCRMQSGSFARVMKMIFMK